MAEGFKIMGVTKKFISNNKKFKLLQNWRNPLYGKPFKILRDLGWIPKSDGFRRKIKFFTNNVALVGGLNTMQIQK